MPQANDPIVIVGNGIAGATAAAICKARRPDAQLIVIGAESRGFFSRPGLMYALAGQLSVDDLFIPADLPPTRLASARGIERDCIILSDGKRIDFSACLLATGSRPRRPSWADDDVVGVGTFVTMQDLAWLRAELFGDHALAELDVKDGPAAYRVRPSRRRLTGRPPRRISVVGGGLIGIEVVEVLLHAGLEVDFFIRSSRFGPVLLDDAESAWIAERLRERGVRVHLGIEPDAIEADAQGAVAEVRFGDRSVPADLVVIAAGVAPNTEFLGDSSIELDDEGAIVVDESLRTSMPNVYAAGDCTSVPTPTGRRRETLWYTARAQGKIAGRMLCDENAVYRRGVPFNAAKLMDVEYTTVGTLPEHNAPDLACWFFEERGKVRSTLRIAHKDGIVVGFNALGRRWDHAIFRRFVEECAQLRDVIARLDEASFDSEFVPRLRIPTGHET